MPRPFQIRSSRASLALALACALAAPALAQTQVNPEIIREGTDDRRQALDEMELTMFPIENWDLVSDWRLADPPTLETFDGKVVLVMTFSGWYPPSLRSLGVINRMAADRAGDGLVVVGVHDAEEWDAGVSAAEARNVSFPIGHDADNLFREALMVDQDPDFYLIDRAGQLRFADIETSSVEAAVDLLLAETRDDAATIVDRIADAQLRAEIEARRTRLINPDADVTEIPAVPFAMPAPDAYALQRWPQFPRDPNQPTQPGQEQPTRMLPLPRDGWYPAAPTGLGRVAVVYFFDRRVPATIDLIDDMDALQRRYSRDIQVVGSMSPIFQDNSGQQPQGGGPSPTDNQFVLRRTHEGRGLRHPLILDSSGTLLSAAAGGQTVTFNSGSAGGLAPTLAAVVSSDGVVRWFGDATSPAFESAVDTTARVDPGVRARRAAEDEYLRQQRR